jgi:motility quorum-sensing regulator/GCU-specific mRNA interferase toxin
VEKRKRTYDLEEIKKAFSDVDNLRITRSGYRNAVALGMRRSDIVEIVQSLKPTDFYKSMTTYANGRNWQDVYYARYGDLVLYVKFMEDYNDYLIVSFKEK